MNRDRSVSAAWLLRILGFSAFLFLFAHFVTYVSLKSALTMQQGSLGQLDQKVTQLTVQGAQHQEKLLTRLQSNSRDVSDALAQVAKAVATLPRGQVPADVNAVAPAPFRRAVPRAKAPNSLIDFDDVPWHLLSNDTEKSTGGYANAGQGQVAQTIYKKVPSLPEVIASLDFTEMTRQTGWTKEMLVMQLKLLLQCNGMPSQKDGWIEKLMRDFIHKNHVSKVDVTPEVATQLMERETCSKLSTHNPEREELLTYFAEFVKLYTDFGHRPIEFNPLGQRLTHSFATWFHVKRMQPKYIIESGVHKGHTTWLMRQAAPSAIMIMLDPISSLIKHWDHEPGTVYYTGDAGWTPPDSLRDVTIHPWIDLRDVDWSFISTEDKRERTLLLIDDHQDEWVRVQDIERLGFKKAMFDDNWFLHQGDNFSIKQLCDASAGTIFPNQAKDKVLHTSNFSMSNKWVSLEEHQASRKRFLGLARTYFEMPPVLWYPSLIMYTQFRTHFHKDAPGNEALVYLTASMVSPPLVQTQEEFDALGLSVLPLREFWYYMNHCFLELR